MFGFHPSIGLVFLFSTGFWSLEAEASALAVQARDILAEHCFACHGPDAQAREANLRFDTLAGALPDNGQEAPIVPGQPENSALFERLRSADPDERMPPPESGAALTVQEIALLERWVRDGAPLAQHWAFAPPQPASQPDGDGWAKQPLDAWVLKGLRTRGLSPAPPAAPETLARRLFLDLTGLPPTVEQTEAFARNPSPAAYERMVDAALESPAFGEHWARYWLDLARYSDTNGYEKDRTRSIWAYRDWVIRALNADMPYDRFTIEQLAGDMLPHATIQQRIATGFHRNTMLNEEGGIDPLEFRFHAMVDRVATTATVWMGLTMGCAQCHDHRYDPLSQTDYYRFMALLDNADEPEIAVPDPAIQAREQQLESEIDALKRRRETLLVSALESAQSKDQAFEAWTVAIRAGSAPWNPLIPEEMHSNGPFLTLEDDGAVFTIGDVTKRDVFQLRYAIAPAEAPITALRLEALPDPRLPAGGPGRAYYEGRKGDFFLSEWTVRWNGEPVGLRDGSHSFGKISIGSGSADADNVFDGDGSTGWSTAGSEGRAQRLVVNTDRPLVGPGVLEIELLFERHFAASLGKFRIAAASSDGSLEASAHPAEVSNAAWKAADQRTPQERTALRDVFFRTRPELESLHAQIRELESQRPEVPTTLVLQERPAGYERATFLRHRGEYLQPRERVDPGLPSVFGPTSPVTNRLELARWLVSQENPLGARVAVNRVWSRFFGRGIVATVGDFGIRGAAPTHPELLDELALWYAQSGYSLKALCRRIVTSATYQQSAVSAPERRNGDPDGRWLSRFPRQRLPAEVIRDSALASSGLLTQHVGGPSVFPPQPQAVTALAYGGFQWKPNAGDDRYRRSIYTFSKRTAPFAAFTIFDGVSGENCVAQRERSMSPLQALTTLNDPMFFECAEAFALDLARIDQEDGSEAAITALFLRALCRRPDPAELALASQFLEDVEPSSPVNGPHLSEASSDADAEPVASAPWTLLARSVFNLDEWIVKE